MAPSPVKISEWHLASSHVNELPMIAGGRGNESITVRNSETSWGNYKPFRMISPSSPNQLSAKSLAERELSCRNEKRREGRLCFWQVFGEFKVKFRYLLIFTTIEPSCHQLHENKGLAFKDLSDDTEEYIYSNNISLCNILQTLFAFCVFLCFCFLACFFPAAVCIWQHYQPSKSKNGKCHSTLNSQHAKYKHGAEKQEPGAGIELWAKNRRGSVGRAVGRSVGR